MSRPPRHRAWVALVSLLGLQTALYLPRIHPGVAEGDAGEIQWAGPLLGICHSPGYALQITVAKLFSLLPIGEGPAWRINFMSAFFGLVGAGFLFDAIRRITGRVAPAWVGGAFLAFSSVYWSYSLIAEVYVFGGAFLILALWSWVRFVQENRLRWLVIGALLIGVAIAERPSECLVLAACLVPLIGSRGSSRGRWWLAAGAALLMPFVLAIALNVMRSDPERLASRDDALRDTLLSGRPAGEVTYDYSNSATSLGALTRTLRFMLGADWSARLQIAGAEGRLLKYGWLLSGLGAWGDRFAPPGETDELLQGGISLGLLALLPCAAVAFRPGLRRWTLCGLAIFLGNLLFVTFYDAFDNLSFTIPGLIGLSLLAGIGATGGRPLPRGWGAICVACALVPLFANLGLVNRNTTQEAELIEARERLAALEWPEGSVIVTAYWPAATLRYLFWVERRRSDISVMHAQPEHRLALLQRLEEIGRPVFFTRGAIPGVAEPSGAGTPEKFLARGFIRYR